MADSPTNSGNGFFRKRIGGVPVIYLAGAVVVVLVIVAIRMKTTTGDSADDQPMETTQNDSTPDSSVGSDYDGFTAKGSVVAAPPDTPDTPEVEETNQTWLKKAVEWRVSNGASGGVVQNALQLYLGGHSLNIDQAKERDLVIRQFGLPPNPPDSTNTPTTPDAPAKAQGPLPRTHKVVNTNDDTFAEIAKLYYPTSDATSVTLIANANRGKLVGTGPFRPGTGVYVPKYTVPKYYTSTKKTNTAAEIAKKNGISQSALTALNPGIKFPVKAGTRVRVG